MLVGWMMTTVTFQLETSERDFDNWLRKQKIHEPGEVGYLQLDGAGHRIGLDKLTAWGTQVELGSDGEPARVTRYETAIIFELTTISTTPNRLEIRATCWDLMFIRCFYQLLERIAWTWWKESKPVIRGYLHTLATELGIVPAGQATNGGDPEPEPPNDGMPWLPKKPETIERWQQAWRHIQDYDKKHKDKIENDWDAWNTQAPPKLADYLDYLRDKEGWPNCEKTVSRIRKAGDAGKLE